MNTQDSSLLQSEIAVLKAQRNNALDMGAKASALGLAYEKQIEQLKKELAEAQQYILKLEANSTVTEQGEQ